MLADRVAAARFVRMSVAAQVHGQAAIFAGKYLRLVAPDAAVGSVRMDKQHGRSRANHLVMDLYAVPVDRWHPVIPSPSRALRRRRAGAYVGLSSTAPRSGGKQLDYQCSISKGPIATHNRQHLFCKQ